MRHEASPFFLVVHDVTLSTISSSLHCGFLLLRMLKAVRANIPYTNSETAGSVLSGMLQLGLNLASRAYVKTFTTADRKYDISILNFAEPRSKHAPQKGRRNC